MSELLFRGYNASKMTVDDGIDIVASKENKYFHIQVKTANVKEDETFRASIKRKTFQHSSDTFYVVVLRSRSEARFENDYVILPSNKIHELVKRGVLKDSETIGLRVSKSNGRFLVSREEDVSHLVNSFDIIR
jgi:Holliday junction resolvase-like predicted endonuclease